MKLAGAPVMVFIEKRTRQLLKENLFKKKFVEGKQDLYQTARLPWWARRTRPTKVSKSKAIELLGPIQLNRLDQQSG